MLVRPVGGVLTCHPGVMGRGLRPPWDGPLSWYSSGTRPPVVTIQGAASNEQAPAPGAHECLHAVPQRLAPKRDRGLPGAGLRCGPDGGPGEPGVGASEDVGVRRLHPCGLPAPLAGPWCSEGPGGGGWGTAWPRRWPAGWGTQGSPVQGPAHPPRTSPPAPWAPASVSQHRLWTEVSAEPGAEATRPCVASRPLPAAP